MKWEEFFEKYGEENVMYHDWPEMGPGSINIEVMYQAFKDRLISETPLNNVVEDGQAKWCPLFEECKFRQERGCDMKCRYYYPPAT